MFSALSLVLTMSANSPNSLANRVDTNGALPRVANYNPLLMFARGNQLTQSGSATADLTPDYTGESNGASVRVKPASEGRWKAPSQGALRGLLRSRDSWVKQMNNAAGIYEFPTSGSGGAYTALSGADVNLWAADNSVWTPAGYFTMVQQSIFGAIVSTTYNIVNTDDWSVISTYNAPVTYLWYNTMAYDEYSDEVTVQYYTTTEKGFATFDIMTGQINKKCVYSEDTPDWKAMAYGKGGKLYALDATGRLLQVNPRTGQYTEIGNVGKELKYQSAAAYDKKSDTFYVALHGMTPDAGLMVLDTETAQLTPIYNFSDGEVIWGLYVANTAPEPTCPSAVTDLTVTRDNASHTFDVAFTMPTTTLDGNPASGNVSYKVYLAGDVVASASSEYGKSEALQLTVEEEGYYSVCVTAVNDEGEGEYAIDKIFIGYDTLLPVENVQMNYDGEKFNVSWNAALPAFGGYVDYDEVTYTVTRMPENVVIADQIHETSCSEEFQLPPVTESYYFTVVANYKGESTTPSSSNAELLGTIAPPFIDTFDTQADYARWTRVSMDDHLGCWDYNRNNHYVYLSTYNIADTNDWLISPAVYVEAGNAYQVSVDLAGRRTGTYENFRLWVGKECAPDAMTDMILENLHFDNLNFETFTGLFIPEESGTVYFGMQGFNVDGILGYTVKADNFSISAPIPSEAPNVVEDLQIKAADYGVLEAEVSFKAPATTIGGATLASIDKITVERNGELIKTLTASPGEAVSFTDSNENEGIFNGNNSYKIVCTGAAGDGVALIENAYIGYAAPVAVTDIQLLRGDKCNKLNISWPAATMDINGNHLPTTGVTYKAERYNSSGFKTTVYEGAELSFEDEVCDETDKQSFFQYVVTASIGGLSGEGTLSQVTAAGLPYGMPWKESFADKSLSSICAVVSASEQYGWGVYGDQDVIGMSSSDGDNGMAVMTSQIEDKGISSDIIFGYVDLSGVEQPYLLFDFYGYNSQNTIAVLINDGTGFKDVDNFTLKEGGFWTRRAFNLSEYKGKAIQIGFRGTINDNPLIAIDNLNICNIYADDLKALRLKAPRFVDPNTDIPLAFAYSNAGINDAADYRVVLYRNGEEIENIQGEKVESGKECVVEFKTQLSVLDRDDVEYKAVIEYASDALAENNEAACVVGIYVPEYPAPQALTAMRDDNDDVVAEWGDPDFSQPIYAATVDGAEDYPAYSIGLPGSTVSGDTLGEWSVIDGDGGQTYSIAGVDYPNEGQAMAWMAFNSTECGLADLFPAFSGDQMFVCFATGEAGSKNDDWLISPQLHGDAQTISFYARTVVPEYGLEQFEVLYSTTGTDRDDFIALGDVETVPAVWTDYRYELPEGTKYFAIHCVSSGTFALSVDEIRFIKADTDPLSLALSGYNVYRNKTRVNEEPVVENTYRDSAPESREDCTYEVTAVYDCGESVASDAVTVSKTSGICQVGDVKISVENHTLIVMGAEGQRLTVCTTSGIIAADVIAENVTRINLNKGVYTLRIGKTTVKVMVK